MGFLFQAILAAILVSLFIVDRPTKLALAIVVLVCLENVQLPFVGFNGVFLFMVCFFLSETPHIVSNLKHIKGSQFAWMVGLLLIATVIAYYHSPHYSGNLMKFINLVTKEWLAKYLIFCYGFLCIREEKDLNKMLHWMVPAVIILFLFGFMNLVTKSATFLDIIGKDMVSIKGTVDSKMYYTDFGRFRVQAMFLFPFDYGFVCVMTFALGVWGYLRGILERNSFIIVAVASLFGIYACGCRTVVFVFLAGGTVFMMSYLKVKRTFVYAVGLLIVIILVYTISPAMQDFLDKTLSVFDPNSSKVEGSSMVMRSQQYAAALWHIKKDLLFGKGIDFFLIDMRWGEGGMEKLVDKDLMGLEGILMNLLLERGFVGVFFYLFVMIGIARYFTKKLKEDKLSAALGLSILVSYLTYANLTGELLSYYSAFFLIGCFAGLIYIQKHGDNYDEGHSDEDDIPESNTAELKLVSTTQRS